MVDPADGARLKIENLEAWYGHAKALHGVSLDVKTGEVVTLLGRNGAGKTTTLRAIMGLMSQAEGRIFHGGQQILGSSPERIAYTGLAFCPEERGIFSSLSVAENFHLPPVLHDGGLSEAELLGMFPNLRERWSSVGTRLSGGEQQMLAIARILRTGAKTLLLDEPNEGLAPVIVDQIADLIVTLKKRGFTILLVEQSLEFAQQTADRHFVLENGQIVDCMPNAALSEPSTFNRLTSFLSV